MHVMFRLGGGDASPHPPPLNPSLSVDQSLTVLTQLAHGTVIKGSGPCIFDLDPDLAS